MFESQKPIVQPPVAKSHMKRVKSIPTSASSQHDVQQLNAGQTIEHERFGIGEVISVEGVGDNAKAKIQFKYAGEKQLLLRFARFKVIK